MDPKRTESSTEARELENSELSRATGGAAGSKSVPSQGGGEQPLQSAEEELESPNLKES